MKKQDWKPFRLPLTALSREINIQGRKVKVSVSPYDIPEAFRTLVDPDKFLVTVELKYIEDEKELMPISLDSDITCYVGKISHRLYKLECKIDPQIIESRDMGAIRDRSLEIVEALSMFAGGKIRQTNSELVQSGITFNASDIELAH